MRSFAGFARFAKCRNAQCSAWARRVNANFATQRGLASAPIMRVCGEMQPLSGFAEQRPSVVGTAGGSTGLGDVQDDAPSKISSQDIAMIINDCILNDTMNTTFSEMLGLSIHGIFNGQSCRSSRYTAR
eukprot:gnl/TRDRNA2_/TRDRNA2_187464_c0_seq1.p1 gnl/TRDRNA2_/TRDRNA2_187464_c0~~gnl/TRDRNA2_/TRDRNA2_187464_c0_seq1.p1  ORF type:complete len:129 (+),score=16.83 gnl/TRDRNA2_/TRDRNA2_187464_c0_seq1:101-487(+)